MSDQKFIAFSFENDRKLPMAAAHTCDNVLSAITEWRILFMCEENVLKIKLHYAEIAKTIHLLI